MGIKYEIGGRQIEVDRELTDEEIEAIAADVQGLYGSADMDVPTTDNLTAPEPPYPAMPQETMSFGETAVESLPAIGGGLAGMAGFAAGGPLLAVPAAGGGGVVGQMAQDIIRGEPFQPTELLAQGATQAVFEAGGTLVVNAAGKVLRYTPDMLRAMGISQGVDPMVAARQAMQMAPTAGSKESLAETQRILQEGVPGDKAGQKITGTLSRAQTGEASAVAGVLESLGELGIFGSGVFKRNDDNIERVLQEKIDQVLLGVSGQVRNTSEIGEIYVDTINTASRTLNEGYGAQLTALQAEFKTGTIDTRAIKAWASGKIKQSKRASESGKFSTLEDETLTELNRIIDLPDSVSGDALLETFKVISQKSSSMLEKGAQGYNSTASAQLTDLIVQDFKPFVHEQLRKINPKAFDDYDTLNANFAASKKLLTPALLKGVAQRGSKADFHGVGAALTETNNTDTVGAAFNALQKAKQVNKDLNVADAMDALRQGYLVKLFGGQSRDMSQVVQAAKSLKKYDAKQQVFNKVLGASAPGVQKLLNAAYDSSVKPRTGILGLMLRGMEAGAISTMSKGGQLAFSGYTASGGGILDVSLALGILGAPNLLAKLALKPSAVNKLLQLDKASSKMAPKLIMSNLSRIANEAGINLEEEIEDELNRLSQGQVMAEQITQVTQ
jgi:hypothetical protein